MTVKELMNRLSELDPELDVYAVINSEVEPIQLVYKSSSEFIGKVVAILDTVG
jgi:hypothetical protein